MGYKVVLAQTAERDRDETLGYLIEVLENRRAAADFMADLDALIENLERYPCMYPESFEPRLSRAGYRKALVGDYLALYRVHDDEVQIARIFHQRQDYARLI